VDVTKSTLSGPSDRLSTPVAV